VLASSYVLMLKTQNFHWNVTGPNFGPLHDLFGKQYEELFAANDEIAERIRALDEIAPGSLAAFARLSTVKDAAAEPPAWKSMIAELLKDHETMSALAGELRAFADEAGDTATGDLMNGRIDAHDKAAWMLRAHLA
ncbi:MAG: DNA starvation/stationary phase protection protein, partial [Alphaproteobacteria bacterium]|nr:DNA starvation/stationary phase protection protein [Alphaproteobacteria bacterium]